MIYALAFLLALSWVPAAAADDPILEITSLRAAKDSLLKTSADSPLLPADRTAFKGLSYYPIDIRYQLSGELHVYGRQRQIEIPNTEGGTIAIERHGRFISAYDGKDFWLEVYRNLETGDLEIFFTDPTNGDTTYEGGRYAYLNKEDDRLYSLDFNNAYNPYCHYNPTYICPLPPLQNHLSFPIRAGELKYGMNLAE